MPVIKGMKTPDERFPGAVDTYTIEAMMQDRKALQAGTSHFLGQNFAKSSGIKFLSAEGKEEIAWTTSWGVSTRLIGGLIMSHSDDDGLILPPKLAPLQVVILPIYRNDEEKSQVMGFVESLAQEIRGQRFADEKIQVKIDSRDLRGGEKAWQYIKQGVPLRIEVGPRDLAKNEVFVGRRDKGVKEKTSMPRSEFVQKVGEILGDIQTNIYNRARKFRDENMKPLENLNDFKDFFSGDESQTGGFAVVPWNEAAIGHELLAQLKVTPRCIPLEGTHQPGTCIFTGKPSTKRVIFAKSY
jgi:prolyl-tRNA synthetase